MQVSPWIPISQKPFEFFPTFLFSSTESPPTSQLKVSRAFMEVSLAACYETGTEKLMEKVCSLPKSWSRLQNVFVTNLTSDSFIFNKLLFKELTVDGEFTFI